MVYQPTPIPPTAQSSTSKRGQTNYSRSRQTTNRLPTSEWILRCPSKTNLDTIQYTRCIRCLQSANPALGPCNQAAIATLIYSCPLPDLPAHLFPVSIRIGQLWHTHSPKLSEPFFKIYAPHGIIFEIRRWIDATTMAVQLWTRKNSSESITSARMLYLATPS